MDDTDDVGARLDDERDTAVAVRHATAEEVVTGVECHNEPKFRSRATGILEAEGGDPIRRCAESMWPGQEAPPLLACANPRYGIVDVFPSSDPDLCSRLGLEPVPAGYSDAAARLAAVRRDVIRDLGEHTCRTAAEGVAAIRRALDRHGFEDWTVETIGFEQRPCAAGDGVWVDARRHVFGLTGNDRPAEPPARP